MKRLLLLALGVWVARWAFRSRPDYDPGWDLPYVPSPEERPYARFLEPR